MIRSKLLLALVLINMALPSYSDTKEGILNKLLAPGPLVEGHKDLEETGCLECHVTAEGIPNNKCLDCHTEIKKSIATKKSFHARNQDQACYECHSDHQGRDYNSTEFDTEDFDHGKTAFRLRGAHQDTDCQECHIEKKAELNPARPEDTRYFGLTTSCNDCHIKDDIHFFKGDIAKKECGTCHSEEVWDKKIQFDHEKDGNYKLEGTHAKEKCETCHLPKKGPIYQWKNLKREKCLTCHEDIHKKNLSKKYQNGSCDTCHSQETWELDPFDHSVTDFNLKGAHKKTDCVDCHKQVPQVRRQKREDWKWKGLKKSCNSCHKDYHGYGRSKSERFDSLLDCKTCHTEISFDKDIDFNHNYDTRFKIDGEHKDNKCFECHVARDKKYKKPYVKRSYQWSHLEQKTCETCHKNPHKNEPDPKYREQKCTSCHVTSGWKNIKIDGKVLDHDDTRFPLTGKHKEASCNDCHKVDGKEVYKFETARQQFCISCHDNVHKKQFRRKFYKKACNECHTTKDFEKLKPFNHGKTNFELNGKHKKIEKKCSECHKPTKSFLPTKPRKRAGKFIFAGAKKDYCYNCHKTPHSGQFSKKFLSKACTTCHTTEKFTKRKKFDHDSTDYKLLHKHKKVKCFECHTKTRKWLNRKKKRKAHKFLFPKLSRQDCASCHKDIHKGTFGSNCSECHSEKGWDITSDFHNNFTLSGVHYTLKCDECHIANRKLAGTSDNCLFCHGEDDYHGRTLPNCADCHRQTFWEMPSFKHSTTGFPLRGYHRVIQCLDCHKSGNYTGIPSDCVACHRSDAASVQSPDHSDPLFNECSDCHTQFSFSGDVKSR